MSFIIGDLTPIGGNARTGNAPGQWAYASDTDDLATIREPGYFNNEVADIFRAGQFLMINALDLEAIVTIETIINGIVTLSSDALIFTEPAARMVAKNLSDQAFTTNNVPEPLLFDTIVSSLRITIENNSEFVFQIPGVYRLVIEPQLKKLSGSTGTVTLFAQLDTGSGFVNIDNTGSQLTTGAAGTENFGAPTRSTVVTLGAGNKLRIMGSTDDVVRISLNFTAAAGAVPAIPSDTIDIEKIADR